MTRSCRRLLLAPHIGSATGNAHIKLEVYAFNPRAQHVYERAEFVVEGRRRAAFVFDGQRIDAMEQSVASTA
jgi:RimJ/RimL family protein N-acetyltransferase